MPDKIPLQVIGREAITPLEHLQRLVSYHSFRICYYLHASVRKLPAKSIILTESRLASDNLS